MSAREIKALAHCWFEECNKGKAATMAAIDEFLPLTTSHTANSKTTNNLSASSSARFPIFILPLTAWSSKGTKWQSAIHGLAHTKVKLWAFHLQTRR